MDFHSRQVGSGQRLQNWYNEHPLRTTGWRPTCDCGGDPAPAVVLDPFFGSGTVGLVANRLGRRCIGIDLKPEYCDMAVGRNRQPSLLLAASE